MIEASHILVVEDDPLSQVLFRDVLELQGFDVAVAGSVDEGRAHLGERKPSLVVMDVQLPGGGGETLLATMRAEQQLAAIPVVAVTAFAMEGDRERLLAAGFDAYMSKPIDTRGFADTVASLLRGRA